MTHLIVFSGNFSGSGDLCELREEVLRLGLLVHLIRAVHVADHAFPIDDEDRAAAPAAAVVYHVVKTRYLELLVAQVREVESTEAVAESAMRVDVVVADRDDLRVGIFVLLIVRPKGG